MVRTLTAFVFGCLLASASAVVVSSISYIKFSGIEAQSILLTPRATIPFTCGTAYKGALYFDTTNGGPCVCNGTNWVDDKDLTTACT